MERISSFLHRKLDNFTLDEYIIMFVVCSIFLPFEFPILTISGVLIYLVITKRLRKIIAEVPKSGFMIIFSILSIIVSFFHKNIIGGLCAIVILFIILFIFYYRTIINKRLFELLLDACCIISLFCFAYAMLEYCRIIDRLNYDFLQFKVEESPKYRINSTFFNANYYSMMIEFIVLICVYKMMQVKQKRRIFFYIITIVCNLFALYLSGSRTAWIPFVVTIPFMFLINKRFGYFSAAMGAIGGCGLMVLIEPSLLQRANILADFMKRGKIWITAIKGIQEHPLFGEGPLTYFHIYKQYHGHPTQHSHSVYLDPILCHGIVGVLLAGIYLYGNLKEVYLLFKRRLDLRLFSLICAFILTVLIHGVLDNTIYWVQTALLFFVVLSASSIYFHKENPIQGKNE